MAAAEPKEDVVLASFATLSILQLIKDAQQKHGLRHGDYQRYRFVAAFYSLYSSFFFFFYKN